MWVNASQSRGVSFWTRHADSTQARAEAQDPAARACNGGLQKLPESGALSETRPLCEGDVKGKKKGGKGKGGKKSY